MTNEFPQYCRLTRDVPMLGGDWKAGRVVAIYSVSLIDNERTLCGLTDLTALEPISPQGRPQPPPATELTAAPTPAAGAALKPTAAASLFD